MDRMMYQTTPPNRASGINDRRIVPFKKATELPSSLPRLQAAQAHADAPGNTAAKAINRRPNLTPSP
jgi:hypothetical protein